MRTLALSAAAALLAVTSQAPAATDEDERDLQGMAVIGNRELPKTLYIVPWKSADLGEGTPTPASGMFSQGLAPLDPEVFRRELDYHDAVQAVR
jgi:hypothetical protein